MSISNAPYPLCGDDEVTRFQASQIADIAEAAEPGICKRLGVTLDATGSLPSGKWDHKKFVKQLWATMPDSAKFAFLSAQYYHAVGYLARCTLAFELAGIDGPNDAKRPTRRD